MFLNKKCCVYTESLPNVLTYVVPKLQRSLNMEHISKMVDDQKIEFQTNRCFSILQSISVAKLGSDVFVLDGQHRLKCYAELQKQGYPIQDVMLPVVVYHVENLDEMCSYYNRLNQHMPIHPIELNSTWTTYEKILIDNLSTTFSNYIKNNENCRAPHISLTSLKSNLQMRSLGEKLQKNAITMTSFWNIVLELNDYISNNSEMFQKLCPIMNKRLEQCIKKADAKNNCKVCVLGIWRRFEWVDICMASVIDKKQIKDIPFASFFNRRSKIPAYVRDQVWKKHNHASCDNGHCFVCNDDLCYRDMECGHIVAHALGGSDTIDNLMPVCKTCNRDMGVMNMYIYKQSIEKFLQHDYNDTNNDNDDMCI